MAELQIEYLKAQLTIALRERDEARAALLEEQTVHAKTMDNFEASAESWLEERTRLLDRLARADALSGDRLKALAEEQAAHVKTRDNAEALIGALRARIDRLGGTA